ncbi:rhomboid family intramembrane serine protease [Pseudoxanthomonas daejeonensis]|uniref:rhomboid family intramembrane serine protease n=1 Tax=Pseudoxanthomonas daejeonensis TaxID=266062 RepID=UPI001F5431C2|nr:rhomboid family intramembrane serine protease [Pseudoxanthomonas daejeonensis]UNK58702.1 rhomboid family intramembrane serine protease [Pseudoxanthomonas daejeonensis]
MSRDPLQPSSAAERDRRRLLLAFNLSLGFIGLLLLVFVLQPRLPVGALAVSPRDPAALLGLLTAPLLHGSVAHLAANATALLILGTLAGSVYPRATSRALPLMWLGSGLGAWLLGEDGTRHLGASGVTHGLMFLVVTLGLLRRDRPSIAAGMIVMLFYGGSVLAVLPHGDGISWQSHLGGALAGVLSGFLFRRLDPMPPRKRYSWEVEEEQREARDRTELEPPPAEHVPVLWQRREDPATGKVLNFPPRPPQPPPE